MSAETMAVPLSTAPRIRRLSLMGRLLRRPAAVVAMGYILLIVLLAVLAPIVAPFPPQQQSLDDTFAPLGAEHWLGTDNLGRDVASRIIYATRYALLAPAIAVGVALMLGVPTALVAALRRGWIDAVLSRIADTTLSLPGLAFALAIVAVMGPGIVNAMVALGITFAPRMYRVVRSASLGVAQETFIMSARAIGSSVPRILVSHVLPNIAAPLMVQTTVLMAVSLIAEAGLSFLGLGVQPPDASWGTMLNVAYQNQFQTPFGMVAPGVAIILTALAFNTLGDAIRDAIADRGHR
jgi:peptide/nickel transport system permease protein